MAKKLMLLALATTFLAVGCVAFPENDGYYDGRYDHRSDRNYDYRYDRERNRQHW